MEPIILQRSETLMVYVNFDGVVFSERIKAQGKVLSKHLYIV